LFIGLLVALRVGPAVLRMVLPFSRETKDIWFRRRQIAKRYDSTVPIVTYSTSELAADRQALDNNEQAKRYLDLLNEMHAEYNQLDSGYANVVTREFKDFEPIMQEVHADSDAYYRLHDAIMRTPITPCPATP